MSRIDCPHCGQHPTGNDYYRDWCDAHKADRLRALRERYALDPERRRKIVEREYARYHADPERARALARRRHRRYDGSVTRIMSRTRRSIERKVEQLG